MTELTNLDFPYDDLDTTHDPHPERFMSPEARAHEAAQIERLKALIEDFRQRHPWAAALRSPDPAKRRAARLSAIVG
jgi:hypothetical protein